MAPRCDSGFSSLLCAEDHTIFDNNEYGGAAEVEEATWPRPNHRTRYQNQSYNGEILPLPSDEFLSRMIELECHHLPRSDYLKRLRNSDQDLMARKEAVDWIVKVGAHFSFGPLSTYLAIIYLDRFLSTYELPKGKAWTMQLLSVACLSLAAKLEETQVPLSLDLQAVGESKFVFESRTIQRMELLVLSTLKWRMQSITPFSFIDYYLHTMIHDQLLLESSILRSIKLFSITMQDIEFLEFRPSEIAAAVAISVAGETQTVDVEKAICLLTQNTQEERVVGCIKLIERQSFICNGSVLDPQSPNGVLEIACLSYRSDETGDGLCESSSHGSPVAAMAKRRRLNRACDVEL